jgi:hypothetical protein
MNHEETKAKMREAQELRETVAKYANENVLFEGRTLSQWRRDFWVKIPEDITFPVVAKTAALLAAKYQHAAFYRDTQNISLTILEQTQKDKYNQVYHSVRTEHFKETGKVLGVDSCKVAAQLAVKDVEDAISNQKIIKDFWTKTCETLTETRKLLESAGRALAGDSYLSRDLVIKGRDS